MNRRSFIGSILALGVAPAIVRADSLMRIVPRDALVMLKIPCAGFNVGDVITLRGMTLFTGTDRPSYLIHAVDNGVFRVSPIDDGPVLPERVQLFDFQIPLLR